MQKFIHGGGNSVFLQGRYSAINPREQAQKDAFERHNSFLAEQVGGSFPDVNNYKNRITPSTKWEQEIIGDYVRAAIQTQGSTSNPFGSTFVYGYQNAAFEVMKNGNIPTVTLFQS